MLNNGTKVRPVQITNRQNYSSLKTKAQNRLGQEFLVLWQQAHGAPQGTVSVTTSQNGVMLLIENAFSQAERTLARQSTDKRLQQYIDSLTHQIMPMLTSRVEQLLRQPIGFTSITSNIEQNCMMVFLKFDEPATSESEL
jgi:hypothetical protein